MKCIICHGTRIEKEKVNEEIPLKNDIVIVPVEVMVCQTCGERYYDRNMKRYLEMTEEKLKKGKNNLKAIGKVRIVTA